MANSKAIGVAFEDQQLDGAVVGRSAAASGTVGFFGKTPVVQRPFTASLHNTTAAAVSASFGASQLAILQEIMNTLIGLGIYATA